MEEILKGLNEQQKRAVISGSNRILCLAGAGSGKTKTLVSRVARLIKEGVDPREILMLTFTRAAANEQKERIIQLAGDEAHDIVSGTFHSWAVKTIRRFPYKIGLTPEFTVYDEEDVAAMVEKIVDELQYRIEPKKVIESMEKNAVYRVPIPEGEIKKAVEEYRFRMKRNNAIDFNGLIDALIYLLKDDTINQIIHTNHKYVFVDEFQDTDHRQMEVLELIDPENLFIVGDDFQSIYGFRGADVSIIIDIAQRQDWETIKLEQNYRSTKEIVSAANHLIRHNHQTEKVLQTDRKGTEIRLHEYEEPEDELHGIAEIIQNSDYEYGDIAVLGRTNKQIQEIAEQLAREDIPCEVKTKAADRLASFEAKRLFTWMSAVLNPTDDKSVTDIINWPRNTISQMDRLRVEMFQIENRCSFMAALEATEKAPEFIKTVEAIKDTIAEEYDAEDPVTASDLLEYVIEETKAKEEYEKQGLTNRIQTIEEIKRIVVEWSAAMTEVGESAAAEEWLDYYHMRILEGPPLEDENKNAVQLMTAHGSKGLEFPEVIIAGCNQKNFPFSRGTIEEERRLFYVAVTRAKDRLELTRAKTRYLWGSHKKAPTEITNFFHEMRN